MTALYRTCLQELIVTFFTELSTEIVDKF